MGNLPRGCPVDGALISAVYAPWKAASFQEYRNSKLRSGGPLGGVWMVWNLLGDLHPVQEDGHSLDQALPIPPDGGEITADSHLGPLICRPAADPFLPDSISPI